MRTPLRHRIISLLLAFFLAFSSFGYAVNLHYCQGSLKSFSLLGKAKSCHESKAQCPKHTQTMTLGQEKDCCSNKVLKVESLDENSLATDVSVLSENGPSIISGQFTNFEEPLIKKQYSSKLLLRPPPPKSCQPIYILNETFLL